MTAETQWLDLPEGFSWSNVWRYPHGWECGKQDAVLFKKEDKDDALVRGAWHLINKDEHPDPQYSWPDAVELSTESVTEVDKEIDIVQNKEGDEVAPPKPKKKGKPKRAKKKGTPKKKDNAWPKPKKKGKGVERNTCSSKTGSGLDLGKMFAHQDVWDEIEKYIETFRDYGMWVNVSRRCHNNASLRSWHFSGEKMSACGDTQLFEEDFESCVW